jgi:hypothetical protein
MNKNFWFRALNSSFDNPKSKIQAAPQTKICWASRLAFTFAICGAGAWAQQPKKIPRDPVIYRRLIQRINLHMARAFGGLSNSLATLGASHLNLDHP